MAFFLKPTLSLFRILLNQKLTVLLFRNIGNEQIFGCSYSYTPECKWALRDSVMKMANFRNLLSGLISTLNVEFGEYRLFRNRIFRIATMTFSHLTQMGGTRTEEPIWAIFEDCLHKQT